jgi:hypothetical protein
VRFRSSTRAHTGHAGVTLSHGRCWRPARRAGIGAHNEMTTARGLVRVAQSDAAEGWEWSGAWAQVVTTRR